MRVATWADIRIGAVVRSSQGYEYTITTIYDPLPAGESAGGTSEGYPNVYRIWREDVDTGRYTLVRDHRPPKVAMGPQLFARLQEIEAGLPPEGMSLAAIVQMCMTYWRNKGQGGDIPRYDEKATRKQRKWVRMQDHPPELPDGLRVVDVIAWRVAMIQPCRKRGGAMTGITEGARFTTPQGYTYTVTAIGRGRFLASNGGEEYIFSLADWAGGKFTIEGDA